MREAKKTNINTRSSSAASWEGNFFGMADFCAATWETKRCGRENSVSSDGEGLEVDVRTVSRPGQQDLLAR